MCKDRIKARAAELGFCKVGFTTTDDLPHVYEEAVRRNYPPFLMNIIERGSQPRLIAPEARSIIVLAYDYSATKFPENLVEHVGRTYLSRSFMPPADSPARERLNAFEAYLEEEGVPFEPDRIQLSIRAAAQRAGVISYGRNNFAYVDGVGSFVTLYAYFTPLEFEPDEPAPDCLCPPNCHTCIDSCPMNAMPRPFDLDAEKCMVWNNALRYSRGGNRDVPEELRDGLGSHVHGCDACQMVCPRNQKALRGEKIPDPVLERIAADFTLENLLHMPEGFYESCVRPIMYNYVNDPIAFQRNAAIAMGNSLNPDYIEHLEAELDHPDEMMREHVRWAINKIKG